MRRSVEKTTDKGDRVGRAEDMVAAVGETVRRESEYMTESVSIRDQPVISLRARESVRIPVRVASLGIGQARRGKDG